MTLSIRMTASLDVLSSVSHEWAKRPDDERYTSLDALHRAARQRSDASDEPALSGRVYVDTQRYDEHETLVATDDETFRAPLSHWAFGQLCSRLMAPAAFLRSLPAGLAKDVLMWATNRIFQEPGRLLITKGLIRAVTSQSYGRIWDHHVVNVVRDIFPEHQGWRIPSASYASKDPLRASTLYLSSHDVFLFLVNESTPIVMGDETLYRGVIVANSEVGASSLIVSTMLYRYVCDNRCIWGPRDIREIRLRHSSGGPVRFLNEVQPMMRSFAQSGSTEIAAIIRRAQGLELGKGPEDVAQALRQKGFTLSQAKRAYELAQRSGLNPRSVWGSLQGLTEQAHEIQHADARVDLETRAGRLLDLVS